MVRTTLHRIAPKTVRSSSDGTPNKTPCRIRAASERTKPYTNPSREPLNPFGIHPIMNF